MGVGLNFTPGARSLGQFAAVALILREITKIVVLHVRGPFYLELFGRVLQETRLIYYLGLENQLVLILEGRDCHGVGPLRQQSFGFRVRGFPLLHKVSNLLAHDERVTEVFQVVSFD